MYYLLSDYFEESELYFKFPALSKTESIKNISICATLLDFYDGEATSCMVLFNIKNNVNYTQNITMLIKYLQTLSFANNITNVIQAA